MGLSQDIVVVNEFSHKGSDGKGSRGNTPGKYVLEYMNREGATETLHPVRLAADDTPEIRYTVKRHAIDRSTNVAEARQGLKDADKYAGRAFDATHVSLTDEDLRNESDEIQNLFDNGHTVMKTVISFTEPYLQSQQIIPNDFHLHNRGDYKGNVDQLRLRLAIMQGLSSLSRNFDNLRYVGAIQVDTRHIHCHLAMADAGDGKLGDEGYQKGKLTDADKRILRQGIDEFLFENQDMIHFSSGTVYDRCNTHCFLKDFTHKIMNREGTQQLLLSVLPKDTTLWSSASLDESMQRPNAIAKDLVRSVANEPNSGYQEALRAEVNHRLLGTESNRDQRLIINASEDMIVDACVDSVYDFLKTIPSQDRVVRTPMLATMSMDYHELAVNAPSDPSLEFSFRLRSYNSRLEHHKKEREKYHEAVRHFETTANTSNAAQALLQFYEEEEDYNTKLMAKYQHFLTFLPAVDNYLDSFTDLQAYGATLQTMENMEHDNKFLSLSSEASENYGMDVYHIHGGQLLHDHPEEFMRRIQLRQTGYLEMRNRLEYRLNNDGLILSGQYGELTIEKRPLYALQDVTALDLHHLQYDFPTDVHVSNKYVDQFLQATDVRTRRLNDATDYLQETGQEDQIRLFPTIDIANMNRLADTIRDSRILSTHREGGRIEVPRETTKLDLNYEQDIENIIRQTITEFEFG